MTAAKDSTVEEEIMKTSKHCVGEGTGALREGLSSVKTAGTREICALSFMGCGRNEGVTSSATLSLLQAVNEVSKD
jgi:hypothetical protein